MSSSFVLASIAFVDRPSLSPCDDGESLPYASAGLWHAMHERRVCIRGECEDVAVVLREGEGPPRGFMKEDEFPRGPKGRPHRKVLLLALSSIRMTVMMKWLNN